MQMSGRKSVAGGILFLHVEQPESGGVSQRGKEDMTAKTRLS